MKIYILPKNECILQHKFLKIFKHEEISIFNPILAYVRTFHWILWWSSQEWWTVVRFCFSVLSQKWKAWPIKTRKKIIQSKSWIEIEPANLLIGVTEITRYTLECQTIVLGFIYIKKQKVRHKVHNSPLWGAFYHKPSTD